MRKALVSAVVAGPGRDRVGRVGTRDWARIRRNLDPGEPRQRVAPLYGPVRQSGAPNMFIDVWVCETRNHR